LAKRYFNGELWHSNHKTALELAAVSPFELAEYEKAAEVRSRFVVPWILATADVLRQGIDSGPLTQHDGS
jgi:hypothetical protein